MKLKILIVQNNPIIGNQEATFNNVQAMLEKHEGESFDLIVFPETWSIGWDCKNFQNNAEMVENSATINFLKNIAMSFKATVIGGSFIQKTGGGEYKNTCPVISKDGRLITTYEKMHLYSHQGSEENKYLSTGEELKILDLGFIKIGLSVCYDIRFPELYREYSKKGVEVFVNVAAWSNKKLEHWDIMHRARAIENQCFMVVADQTGKISRNEINLGHSMVINPWGDIIAMLEAQEDCLTAEIDLNEVKDLRKNFPLISDRRDLEFNSFKHKEIKLYE